MRIKTALWALACALGCYQTSWAHPGHAVESNDSTSLIHYFSHPDHLVQWSLAIFAIGIAAYLSSAFRKLTPAYARVRRDSE